VEEYVEDPGRAYLAPESAWGDLDHGPHLDVFSLGAIAYHVFSGQAPAASIQELHDKLRAGPGLKVSDVLDGCGKALQDLVQFATMPDVSARYASADEFLKALDEVEEELTAPDPERTVDPSVAKRGDRIEGGFTVVERIGKGSSSDVLLVRPDGREDERVLKVASNSTHNERLVAEGEALSQLRYPNIVEWERTLTVNGRTALLMRRAGDQTLAQVLKSEARPSLDLMRRFGEELIQTVDYLEQQGIAHRDIKPDNIGMSQVGTKGKKQLVLFDFSLSRTSPDNISAGTHPYLDPFLPLRRRWDLYAERFALAVTLYEMMTGTLPRWGDGKTQPAMLECEASLDSDLFDPHLREGLSEFFEKALRRDFRARFDNAEEMLHAWRHVFDAGRDLAPDAFEVAAQAATAATTMAELGYGIEAQNVLEGMGVHNAKELLAVDRIRFRYLKGVGDRVRKEIRLKAKQLAHKRPDLAQGRVVVEDAAAQQPGLPSVDELAAQLLPRRPAGDDRPEEAALALYLGIEEQESDGDGRPWTHLGEAAAGSGVSREALTQALLKARERWLKSPTMTLVRGEIESMLDSQAGAMTAQELALGLLARHGSLQSDDNLRLRLSMAVLRACCEAESQLSVQRFQVFERDENLLVALREELATYAFRLGEAADEVAGAEPLLAPQRALECLEAVAPPESVTRPSSQRLLRLATAVSRSAALSSRQEIYPRGMAAVQALRQSLGALTGAPYFRVEDVRDRVRGRYPEAAPLPGRPQLDDILQAGGCALLWQESGARGPGYYVPNQGLGPSAGTTTYIARHGTRDDGPVEWSAEVAAAVGFEERLALGARSGGFLAITVPTHHARQAEAELLGRFDLERVALMPCCLLNCGARPRP
jgi:serine/threonine protein kinase